MLISDIILSAQISTNSDDRITLVNGTVLLSFNIEVVNFCSNEMVCSNVSYMQSQNDSVFNPRCEFFDFTR